MLEARVGRLEDDMKEVKADLKGLRGDMTELRMLCAEMNAKLDSKVDYKWLTVYVLGIVAVVMRNEIIGFLTGSTAGS